MNQVEIYTLKSKPLERTLESASHVSELARPYLCRDEQLLSLDLPGDLSQCLSDHFLVLVQPSCVEVSVAKVEDRSGYCLLVQELESAQAH